jgi:hypothetical protein
LGIATDAVSPMLATIYTGDATLLERLTPRKELRRTGNLVRLFSERIDNRALVLETPWFGADALEGGSDSDGADEDGGEVQMEAIGSGTDEEEEATDEDGSVQSAEDDGSEGSIPEDDDDDDEEENADVDEEDEDEKGDGDKVSPNAHSSSARKRKRPPSLTAPKQQSDSARPLKKVTFAAEVVPSNKRTLSRPSATTPSSKKANSGARSSTQHAPAGGTPILRARKSAANAPMMTTAQKRKQAASAAGGEDDAYDFSKFF